MVFKQTFDMINGLIASSMHIHRAGFQSLMSFRIKHVLNENTITMKVIAREDLHLTLPEAYSDFLGWAKVFPRFASEAMQVFLLCVEGENESASPVFASRHSGWRDLENGRLLEGSQKKNLSG